MAAIIPEVLPEIITAGAEVARGAVSVGESAVGLGSRVITGLEKGAESIGGLFNKAVSSANDFLGTPLGKIVAGGGALSVIQDELRNKNVDIKVQQPDYSGYNPIITPLPTTVLENKEAIKQQYAPVMSKVQRIINSQITSTPSSLSYPNASPMDSSTSVVTSTSGPVTPSIINPPAAPSATFNRSMAMLHGF